MGNVGKGGVINNGGGGGYNKLEGGGVKFYCPPEVMRGKYWGLGVFRKEYFRLVSK